MTWERARKPEQVEARRQAILGAAAKLFIERGFDNVSLNAIAAEAKLAKSNVYRYFESREQIFLELLEDDIVEWAETVCNGLAGITSGDIGAAATILSDTLADRPRLATLLSVTWSVLERNVTLKTVVAFKLTTRSALDGIVEALGRALPTLLRAEARQAIHYIGTFAIGLWPMANPNEVLVAAYEELGPEAAPVRFRDDLARFCELMLSVLAR